MNSTRNIVILNPNSTQSMTEEMANVAIQTIASMATIQKIHVTSRTNEGAPAAIQGPIDAQAAIAGMLRMVDEYAANIDKFPVDSIIIGCADDVGLNEIHDLLDRRFAESGKTNKPTVLGITQAASIAVLSIMPPSSSFGIVTTVPEAVHVLEANLKQYGTYSRCACVIASQVLVLELEQKPQESLARLYTTIAQAQGEGATAIILGCAGMSHLRSEMRRHFPSLLFIDGVQAATRMAVAMHGLGR